MLLMPTPRRGILSPRLSSSSLLVPMNATNNPTVSVLHFILYGKELHQLDNLFRHCRRIDQGLSRVVLAPMVRDCLHEGL